ncbi:U3 small nucleolar RNA-associated protein 18 [Chlorella vulgaris]
MEDDGRRKRKASKLTEDAVQREAELEGLLFGRDEEALDQLGREGEGDGGSVAEFLRSYAVGAAAADGEDVEDADDTQQQEPGSGRLMFEDRQGARDDAGPDSMHAARQRRRPVWEDPQDEHVRVNVAARSQLRKLRQAEAEVELTGRQYEQRLRAQHNKLNPRTAWASLKKAAKRKQAAGGGSDSDEAAEAAERLLQRAGGLLARGAALPPSMLETTRLKDANQAAPCKGAVKSVEFHHSGELLLTAGLDQRVHLFTVDGVKNPRSASWFIEDMPVHKAAFTAGGRKVVLSGRRRFFYLLDVETQAAERLASLRAWREEKSFESFVTSQHSSHPIAAFFGNEGHVPLVSLHSKQMVGTLKMNGTARTGAFSADGTQLLTSGGDGTVYVWDLRTQRCMQRYQDEGCLNSANMSCSPDGALFATGKPLKTVLNLDTATDTLSFNHDAQMMVMASRLKRDALRLVHIPSMTVFSNWPTSKSPLHYVHSAAFSPNSGYLAIGNARGRRLQFVGGGAASGGGGAVAVRVFCVAVCIGSTLHMLCQVKGCRLRRWVLSGGLGQRTCLRFQALAKAVPEAYQLLYPKGLQRLAAQLRERDCCGYLLGQPLNPPAEPAMNTAVVGWEEEGTVAADGVEEELAVVGRLVVGLEVAGTAVVGWDEEGETVAVGGEQEGMAAVGWLVAGLEVAVREALLCKCLCEAVVQMQTLVQCMVPSQVQPPHAMQRATAWSDQQHQAGCRTSAPAGQGRDALTPVLAALFNAVFRSGCFPPEWSLGAITPIHKKGDTADPNNYRGITVGHILGKLYALAINTRLNTWLETQGLRARGQAGFRQGYRTVDNCFILRALAERARSRGVKLYLCAVDFEKAFDSVDRPLLWAALQRADIGGTMLQAIQAMYADVPVCVRTEEGLSGCFQSVLGVKQGCPLSPLLFGIFLDDFEGHIQQLGDTAALPQLAGHTVPPLLFADDMFLLSSSASGLQAQLHALQDYCNAKKLTVNAKKTQVMIMRPGGGSGNGKLAAGESFAYAGLPLEVASSTKYLGLTFSQLSKQHGFASCADVLAKAGRQAMFAMRRRAWELGACLVEQQCMLFDVFVKPVLSYGCELWGVDVLLRPDCSSVERVHRWFCRRVQGLPKQVTAAISLAELGRQPLQSFWIQQLVRFWNRLQNSAADEDRVLGWAFKDNLELMREGGDLAAGSACWSRRWLHVLQSAPPASGTLEWLTELDEAAVIERAAAAYLRKCLEPKTRPLPKTPAQDPPPPAASCTNKFAYYMHHIRPNLPLCQPAPHFRFLGCCRWLLAAAIGWWWGLGVSIGSRLNSEPVLLLAVPEAYQLLYPKGLQRLATQLRERDRCGYLLGQPLNPPAEPAVNTHEALFAGQLVWREESVDGQWGAPQGLSLDAEHLPACGEGTASGEGVRAPTRASQYDVEEAPPSDAAAAEACRLGAALLTLLRRLDVVVAMLDRRKPLPLSRPRRGRFSSSVLTDPSGINGRSLWSALQRLQFVGGGAASGGGGAVAVLTDPSGINGRSLWSALQRLQFVGGGAAIGSQVLTDPSGINGRSLWSALQRLQFVGGGAASGGGGAVALKQPAKAEQLRRLTEEASRDPLLAATQLHAILYGTAAAVFPPTNAAPRQAAGSTSSQLRRRHQPWFDEDKYGLKSPAEVEEYITLLGDEVAQASACPAGADVLLAGDMNAHTGSLPDVADHSKLLHAALHEEAALDLAPCTAQGSAFAPPPRISTCTAAVCEQGKALLQLCCITGMLIANGRVHGDVPASTTCYSGQSSSVVDYMAASPSLLSQAAELQVLPEIPEYRGHRALSLELVPSPAPQRSTAKHADPESEGFGPPPTFAAPLRLTPDRLSSFAAELKQPAKAEQLRRLTEEASRDPLLAATQLHAILYGTAAAVFPPTNAAPRQAAGSTSSQLRRRHQPWFDEDKYGLKSPAEVEEYITLLGDEVAQASACPAGADVLLAGDMNAHTGSLPDVADHSKLLHAALHEEAALDLAPCTAQGSAFAPPPRISTCTAAVCEQGKALLQLCCITGMLIANGRVHGDVPASTTCYSGQSSSVVDYMAASPSLLSQAAELQVLPEIPEYRGHRALSLELVPSPAPQRSTAKHADPESEGFGPPPTFAAPLRLTPDRLSSFAAELKQPAKAEQLRRLTEEASRDPLLAATQLHAILYGTAAAVFPPTNAAPRQAAGSTSSQLRRRHQPWFDEDKYGLKSPAEVEEYITLLGDEVAQASACPAGADVLLAGDMNAHTGSLPDVADHSKLLHAALHEEAALDLAPCTAQGSAFAPPPRISTCTAAVCEQGKALLQLCCITGMLIANGRVHGDVPASTTCYSGQSSSVVDYMAASPSLLSQAAELQVLPEIPEYRGHRALSLELVPSPAPQRSTAKHADPESEGFGPPPTFAAPLRLTPDRLSSFAAELKQPAKAEQLRRLTEEASRDPLLAATQLHAILYGTAAAVFPPTNAAPRQAAGSTSSQLRRRHQPWFDEECAATRRQIRLQMQASLNSGQPSHLAKEALRSISNRYTRLRKRKAGAWQRQQGSSLLHLQRTDARKFFKQWQRERPKSPIDAATWLRHFVNLQLKRTFQPTASLTATSNPATSHPTAAIPSCSPPTATVSPSSSHPTTAVPATSNPTTSRPTTASSSSTPSAATVPSSSQPTTALPATNPATSHSTPRSTASSELDSDISVADVHAALDKLSSSSACLGPLKAVLIKAGRDALTPVLAALFNAVFRSGCFPPEWSLGAITPIHKKGDTADPNNYRGITVGHILGKLYALAINTRLNTWLETQGLRARGQAGFRQGYRTVDNCFILRALAERARSRGVKLYLCAVDFEKAFDSVDRPLLWAALQRAGIGGTMLQAIQAMYADVPVCVRTEEGLSGCFQSVLGVKQGCPLSPLLFGIFLDDFEGHIQQLGDAAALPQLAGRTVPPLLFADDMFLLSSSASGLQAQLHALQDYCNAKKLTVNAKKTQVMIMRPGGGSGNGKLAAGESFAYAGLPLEVASSTKYLGLTFSQLSKQHGFASCADVLAKAGRQAMFAVRRRAWELGACLVEQQCMLFDVFVKPVLSYGCELWGVDVLLRPDCSSVERVHRWFCRRVQGLPKQVTAAISLAELGRQPLQSFWIQQLVRFWNRLQNSAADEDRVLGWAFKDNLELMREGGDLAAGSACWSRRWLHVLQSAPPASGTLEWLTELDEAAVIERAAAAYLRKCLEPKTRPLPKTPAQDPSPPAASCTNKFAYYMHHIRPNLPLCQPAPHFLNSGQPSHLAKEALRSISNRYTRLRKRKAGAWQRQQGSSLLHLQRTDARKFFKQWQRERPKSPIDAATWLRHFVNLQLKRTFQPTASLTATSNPATSHPTAAIPSCSPPTATVSPSSSHPTTAVPATSNPTTSRPTTASSSSTPSAATVPSSSQPTTALPATNPATSHSTPRSTASSELDSDISVADVHAALDKLSSSSACLGPLKAVLIKAGRDALTPVLAALFNAVFRSGCFPPEWSLGAITPIHKKGDTADPNNYRGITVGHILGKLYALAINTRLNTWLETQGLRARGQAGFRQGYRTVDNCFILRALAERARSRGVKLYLCAVDFEKAFDSVDRPLLWAALQRAGIGGTMLQAIQAMYADVPVCVRTEEGLSGCFQSVLGVKQGCPLSPLLFGIFLDDFEGHIQQLRDAAALPQLAGRTVPPLLFADDMFLLSSSASGLQAQLHALQDYCNAKKLTVNAKKTQVMIMRPGGGSGNGKLAAGESFAYAGLPLEVASSTKYLGLTFSQLSKQHGFASCADVLAKAGRQAMFAVRRRAWELGACLVEQQCMLFDVFVKPVLSYGCELWGVDVLLRPDCSSVERVHRWFCRRVQGLPKQVTAAISLAELGRQPLQSFWIQQLVRFWNRLQNSAADEDRVLGWAFKDNLELMREGGDLAAGSAFPALQRAGIGGTMLQAIQAMYADVPVCVRTEEGLSGCFQSVLGVKQGCPLSPLLFGIFLDDFEGHIQQLGDTAALPQLAGHTVPPLLFADDMFLLSSSASGLQAQLHALQDYCNAKKLTVNAKKTQVMIMRPGGGSGNGKLAAGESFAYAGLPLEVASSTKYLGLTFSQLSKQHGFASCADVLAKAGRQAMFAMRRRAWELGACLVEQQCMLFDVFVKPVLSYGCELWGVDVLLRPDCSSVERVHRWFCRRVQGLPKQVTAAISLAELGRQPLQSFWIQQLNSAADEDRVLGWAFKDNLELMREGGDLAAGSACWSRRWLHVLQSAPPASGTLEWLTELDEAAVIERAAAAYLRKCLEPKTRPLPKTPAQDPPPPAASCTNKFAYYMHHIRPNLPLCQPAPHLYEAVPEAYQLLYPKGLQRLATQLRERDRCGYLLGQPLNPPAEPAVNTFY